MKKGAARELKKVDASIEEYFIALEYSDTQTSSSALVSKLPRDIEKLQTRRVKLKSDIALLQSMKKEQYNRTDPDATLMSKPAHNLMAYNAQIAVDSRYKFIVATDITSEGSDKKELHRMTKQTEEITDNPDTVHTADKGYYSTIEIKKCIDEGIGVFVSPTLTGQEQRNRGKFGKEKFVYDKAKDGYICPNNELIPKSSSNHTSYQRVMHLYRISSKVCQTCLSKAQCLGEKSKQKQSFGICDSFFALFRL